MAMIAIMRSKQYNTAQAKDQFNRLVADVNESRRPILIEKRGKAVAVLIDMATYREKIGADILKIDDHLLKDLQAFHRRILKETGRTTGDGVQILSEIRREH